MSDRGPVVYVVDDDPDVLKAIERLLLSVDLAVQTFQSPQLFLQSLDSARTGCLVVDLAMPRLSGLELQEELQRRASLLPIVFLTGRGNIATSVRAMKRGAVDFLTKPVEDATLVGVVRDALVKAQGLRQARDERARMEERLATLTARERQVLEYVVAGRRNKQIAADLGTAEKTVKFHRGNVMRKMSVRSVADLVKLAQRAGIGTNPGA